jgi:hypothetical protein
MALRTTEIYKGDTKTYNLLFKDKNGLLNITGWTLYFTLKSSLTLADNAAEIAKVVTNHSDPTHGRTTIPLTSSDTNIAIGTYYYDIRVVTNTNSVYTVLTGTIRIINPVTLNAVHI